MSSSDTKDRILDTAERLFADEGFAGTSLRTITAEAGVNLAAVHYHFGGKEDLMQAVFGRRMGPIHRDRLELLNACEAREGVPSLEGILDAFLRPPLRLSREPGGAVFMRLLGRLHAEPGDLFKKMFCSQFSEVMTRFSVALQRVLPDVPPVELYWRIHFLHGVMGTAMSGGSKLALLSGGLCSSVDSSADILERMIPFLAAGFRAPWKLESLPCEPSLQEVHLE